MARPEPSDPNETLSRHRSLDDPATARGFLRNVGEGVYISDLQGHVLDRRAHV